MSAALNTCVVCEEIGVPKVWNSIPILACPRCGLAWRSSFDLPPDYYRTHKADEPDPGALKIEARIRNARDRLAFLRPFLSREGVCDIGCGDGSFLEVLRTAGYVRCWGIEPSSQECRLATKKNLDVVQGDLTDLPDAKHERELKTITLFHVLEHLSNPGAALQMCAEVLPRYGRLVIETPDAEAALQRITNHANPLVYPEHLFYWTQASLEVFLGHHGFRVRKITRRSFDWQYAPIRSSLLRLGLRITQGEKAEVSVLSKPEQQVFGKRRAIRALARSFLAHLVHLLGCDDYMLLIAERV